MSKRVNNKRGTSRKTPARSRVTYGWRTIKAMAQYHKLNDALSTDLDDKIRAKFEQTKSFLKTMIPKKLLRRHQGR